MKYCEDCDWIMLADLKDRSAQMEFATCGMKERKKEIHKISRSFDIQYEFCSVRRKNQWFDCEDFEEVGE